ncbi:Platinum sensitivity protein [Saitoella coloradoensis]
MSLDVPSAQFRVKVYQLKDDNWDDKGTGHCTGLIENDEAWFYVRSENDPKEMLLKSRILREDVYQKQQETLIVWTEANGEDMALSFQEADGCAEIWNYITNVQRHMYQCNLAEDILSDDAEGAIASPVHLPAAEIGNLQEIENRVLMASHSIKQRESLAKFVLQEDYIAKLVPLLEMLEDLESLSDLHRLCNIMKVLILINDASIFEVILKDENILGVVGILEYDPDFPGHKANHRQYLSDPVRFKQVVEIENPEIRRKIHQTFRLQYLKDVVLARILDDNTFSLLNSLIFFNQVDIVQHLQSNSKFLTELFGIFKSGPLQDPSRKADGVRFIQQFCQIAKQLQSPARTGLYTTFVNHGLFGVIDYALLHEDPGIRIAGTDVVMAIIDHDPTLIRSFILKQDTDKEETKSLTDTLMELAHTEKDLGVKALIAEAIRVLVDPAAGPQPEGQAKPTNEFVLRQRVEDPEADKFLQFFYDNCATKLMVPLMEIDERVETLELSQDRSALFTHLCELLCFFLRFHTFRSKYFVLSSNISAKVGALFKSSEKHVKLAALRYFRTCIGLNDEFYKRHLIKNNLFAPIIETFISTGTRYNMLNSACLEFFEFIRKEAMKNVIIHIVENFGERLREVKYVETFEQLVARYEQFKDKPGAGTGDGGEGGNSEGGAQQMETRTTDGRWQSVKPPDAQEEDYFNTDDELEKKTAKTETPPTAPSTEGEPATTESPATEDLGISVVDVLPPDRLSEKRRREEEDEEDQLGLLSRGTKRTASPQSVKAVNTPSPSKEGRPTSADGSPTPGAKKIVFSFGKVAGTIAKAVTGAGVEGGDAAKKDEAQPPQEPTSEEKKE